MRGESSLSRGWGMGAAHWVGAKSSRYGGTMHAKAASPTPESARAKMKK